MPQGSGAQGRRKKGGSFKDFAQRVGNYAWDNRDKIIGAVKSNNLVSKGLNAAGWKEGANWIRSQGWGKHRSGCGGPYRTGGPLMMAGPRAVGSGVNVLSFR